MYGNKSSADIGFFSGMFVRLINHANTPPITIATAEAINAMEIELNSGT